MPKNNLYKISILALLVLGLYAPVLWGLVKDWWVDANYSHGFLIPVISGYLLWERRAALARLTPKPANTGLVLVVAALLMLMAGDLGSELFLQRISLLLLLTGILLFVAGTVYLRGVMFPLGLLLLMIPLPAIILYQVTLPLQLLASQVATQAIRWAQIPVLREGNIIHLAHTSLEVVEACSGIRSLFTLATIGLVIAYFTHERADARLFVVASTVPIAILANAARLTITAALAHYFGERPAQGFFHLFSGWLIVLLACLLLLLEVEALGWIAQRLPAGHREARTPKPNPPKRVP